MKIYFIRPKPEYNCEEMLVYLVLAENEENAWKIVDIDRDVDFYKISSKDKYFIQEEFLPTNQGSEEKLIWGLTNSSIEIKKNYEKIIIYIQIIKLFTKKKLFI
jgi:hypothetical protein